MGSTEDDDTTKGPGQIEATATPDIESAIYTGRSMLFSPGGVADASSSEISAEQYTRLVINGLTGVVSELRAVQSPKQLSPELKDYLIGSVGRDQELLLKATNNLIEKVLELLREIQKIEESAGDEEKDQLYERLVKIPLAALITALEAKL